MGRAAVFEAGDPPRTGVLAFWRPDGAALPQGVGEPGELEVVLPQGAETVRRYHGAGRSLADLSEGFALTTYTTMRLDAALLGAVPWGLVCRYLRQQPLCRCQCPDVAQVPAEV
ncbi:hypothetical protein [Nocardiopsis ansamitocini]|uniref:Uncharacterized protein n=1 Tax=Nocardiopsis ansamitocini TaxID=1670832 RepID=A0A9W6UJ86_9ACTN|nr:hypothetical protein [Nocardiopsis ansamitocini]GLU48243.1 hypothetical protein Nans01_25940 [Nocardiopsis ansamitocini]